MSLAVLYSRALSGMEAPEVVVEVHLANGLPSFTIVGLPETEVKESKDRVRAAIQTAQFEFPARRITVNLAPADLPKEGGRYDLPIALGILAASGQLPKKHLADYVIAGELALTGALRPVRGALAMAYQLHQAPHTTQATILPRESACEASLVEGSVVYAADSLLAVCAHLSGKQALPQQTTLWHNAPAPLPDYQEVKGQLHAKRALELAAAGQHSLLMSGPPGTGKSMLAHRFISILPDMTTQEALESAAILSLNGQFPAASWKQRPLRAPHHTSSAVALVGGGSVPRPGEISLAHHGVLFLDELPEFDRKVLEVLREPLESGNITISRAARQATFPAQFQLLAAMNPCPCGYYGHYQQRCRCTPDQVARYKNKLSGPLLDRIDMNIDVPALKPEELSQRQAGESSAAIRERVVQARERQMQRQGKPNAALGPLEIEIHCPLTEKSSHLLQAAMQKFALSARSYHRILKLARTIADLAGSPAISDAHIAEALQYRRYEH
ncbi:magnesium chelatase family protein [Methylophilus rhizosphaerae]|uniref:Magnesium chelatase family protein n=1 Tax=Methylophilus rhizosphaerae TaxID=492660 RepID=A0A1G9E3J9_9PROT|nr:YifB family Mg chelatase-like AAA ATPase [Methylophilus rhizosphaerae]SDK70674.1 magnesium chelatase family protein [Methylophilus rhizosphaerae]